jgi:cytochrome c peroxidase
MQAETTASQTADTLPPEPTATGSRPFARARNIAVLIVAMAAAAGAAFVAANPQYAPSPLADTLGDLTGANPHPVRLVRPADKPLSAMAQLGKQLFFDPSLSASGKMSCASCHSPLHAYGPANALPVQLGGATLTLQGDRPPPSLMYLYRQPNFSIGPSQADADEPANLAQSAAIAASATRAQKSAGTAQAETEMVPQGGMFWDGRADTLQAQALGPLLNPVEMANASEADVLAKLERSTYRASCTQLFGPDIFKNSRLLLAEAMFAIARYQVEEPSFHPYSSKYDAWLEGRARLTQAELRGLKLFNDPHKANCAGCHLSKPGKDGLPPMFTDYEYEALGVPRNQHLNVNRDPAFYDMGLCGPHRTDLAKETQYCGMFLTPTLRNTATRSVFFHNGVYRTLDDVLAFYNFRDVDPTKVYPHDGQGRIEQYDDLPARYQANIDRTDAPFDRKRGDTPAMTAADMKDIIAFLGTLTDGYQGGERASH